MKIQLDIQLAEPYKSLSQKARVLTEGWIAENMYCPVCGHRRIVHFDNNSPVADYYCPSCCEQYEIKSKNGDWGSKIVDGAYDTFIRRVKENTNPDFLLMNYSMDEGVVKKLCFVPKFFFVPEIAERRKPLSSNAKRSGWVGCNILYNRIPQQGIIPIIENKTIIQPEIVIKQVQKAFKLKTENLNARGWMFDVLHCVNAIPESEFTLAQVYQSESIFEMKYSKNRNIKAKIRQQLQILRDNGIIEFLGRGRYRKIL